MIVPLAGTSQIKSQALQGALDQCYGSGVQIQQVPSASSGVPSQPVRSEIERGSRTRAAKASRVPPPWAFSVGIENGLRRIEGVDLRRYAKTEIQIPYSSPRAVVQEDSTPGVQVGGDLWVDYAIITLRTPQGFEIMGRTLGVVVPHEIVQETFRRGRETNTWGEVFAERVGCNPNDPHSAIKGPSGVKSRKVILQETLVDLFKLFTTKL